MIQERTDLLARMMRLDQRLEAAGVPASDSVFQSSLVGLDPRVEGIEETVEDAL